MLRAVIDTNVLLASVGTASPYRWLFEALLEERFVLCVTTPILLEYEAVIARKATPLIASNVLRLLVVLPNVEAVLPRYRWRLITADPDDDKFVDCALAANAHALVTHDRHFDALRQLDFPRIPVMVPEAFRSMLDA